MTLLVPRELLTPKTVAKTTGPSSEKLGAMRSQKRESFFQRKPIHTLTLW